MDSVRDAIALAAPDLDITIVPRDGASRAEPIREREMDAAKRAAIGWRYVWTFAMSAAVTPLTCASAAAV